MLVDEEIRMLKLALCGHKILRMFPNGVLPTEAGSHSKPA